MLNTKERQTTQESMKIQKEEKSLKSKQNVKKKKVETALEAQNADFPFSALVKETQEEKRNLAALLFTLNLSWQEAFW